MYQLVTQDCERKDSSYNGTWYCAKMEVCESFMNKNRECIVTRGCATSEECTDTSSSTGYYNGNKIQTTSGVNPGGMTVTATCCKAYEFSDDDTIAINYDDICNSANSIHNKLSSSVVVGIAAMVAIAQYMLHQ